MSLILDALNKADREQEAAPVPNLKTHHAPGKRYGLEGRWVYAIAALVIGLVLLCALLLVLYFRAMAGAAERVGSPPSPVKPVPDSVSPVSAETLAAVRIRPLLPPDNVAPTYGLSGAERDSIAALYQPSVNQEVQNIQEPQVRSQEPERAPPSPSTVDAALAKALWDESNIRYTPPPQPQVETPAAAPAQNAGAPPTQNAGPPPAEGETLAGNANVPFLHDLSTSVQNNIPTLMYAGHNYAEGYALINKKQVQEGDTLAEQLSVYKVLADGVVFQFGGEQFKLSALNSWVNF